LEAALGSAYEIESQLIIALEIEYISKEQFKELEKQIHKLQSMIAKFIDNLK
jgi:four helix bundle protein